MKIDPAYFFVFTSGLVLQAFSMLMGKWRSGDFKEFIFSLAPGFFGMIPGKNENDYDLSYHLILSCVIAAFSFTAVFRKRLISFIGARTLIVLNIITLFLVYYRFGFSYWLFGLLAIPSAITLINGFTNIDKYFSWQVFFYSWFSIMVVIISIVHFAFGDLMKIFGWSEKGGEISYISIFLSGAAFLYIISNIWYVIQLIPYTGKHQSMDNRIIEIKKHMQLLAYGYIWEKDDLKGNLIILVLLPVTLALNHQTGVLSENLFVSFVLAVLPALNHFKIDPKITDDGIGDIDASVQKVSKKHKKELNISILTGVIIILLTVFFIGFGCIYYLAHF